jgi:hypothetical protein
LHQIEGERIVVVENKYHQHKIIEQCCQAGSPALFASPQVSAVTIIGLYSFVTFYDV